MRLIYNNIELILAVALIFGGLALLDVAYCKLDPNLLGALVGALFAAAALVFGNWISRFNERRRAAEDLVQRREKLQVMIAAELVNIATGIIGTYKYVQSAITSSKEIGPLGAIDISLHRIRRLMITENLIRDLWVLEKSAIDALLTLRSNLEITQSLMDEGIASATFGLMRLERLKASLSHDMEILTECFERIAPDRKLTQSDEAPELFSVVLRRMTKE